ncbi:alpha-1,6-mannosyl-glycoprotein 2-beta-N-acetylglucosaminyltransferase-like [Haemaphysalis longicornis]
MQPMFHDSRMFSLRRRRLRLAHNRFSALLCCCCCCCCCCALLVTSKLVYYVSQGSANQGSPPNRDPVVADLAPPTTIEDLHFIAYELNRQQAVHHEDEFGPLTPSDPVIVVQVHNRWRYLKLLLRSLSLVKGIDRALLILSHDYYDAHAHNLSKTVTFCKVMQIYFPYSTQLYPTEFPGTHPNDCPRNMNIEQARKMKCNGANFPDAFGHYRESAFTQIKHHWWWKANFVMESLNATRKHDGPILLLEEDYYVSADYLAAVRLLLANKPKFCGYNICLCMVGNLNNDYRYEKYLLDKVEVRPWANSTNNMGIILTRDTWEVMRGCFGVEKRATMLLNYVPANQLWAMQLADGFACMGPRPLG